MNSILTKVKDGLNSVVAFTKKAVAGVVSGTVGAVAYASNAQAAITLDTTTILADIATIGTAVVGIVLATVAFKIAKSMLGGTR
ncbi:MAG: hypothetical protein VW455_13115 [Nitrospinota bacterium]